jgi:hypothetical protein
VAPAVQRETKEDWGPKRWARGRRTGNDQPLAILRVRVAPGRPRRLDNFTCCPAVDRRNVMAERRRFPPPWDIEEANAACFIVKDNNGQALRVLRARAGPAHCRQPPHPRRGAAHRRQNRQSAGFAAERVKLVIAGTRVIPLFHRRLE